MPKKTEKQATPENLVQTAEKLHRKAERLHSEVDSAHKRAEQMHRRATSTRKRFTAARERVQARVAVAKDSTAHNPETRNDAQSGKRSPTRKAS
jgi:hypothetical protein